MVNRKLVEIPKKVVDKFVEWSFDPFNQMPCYDQKLAHALMIIFKGLKDGVVNGEVKNFIKGNCKIIYL